MKILTENEFFDEFGDEITNNLYETGAYREMDFDFEKEIEKRYTRYLINIQHYLKEKENDTKK